MMREFALLVPGCVCGLACSLPVSFVLAMLAAIWIGREPWLKLRRRSRPLLWQIGLDWPEYTPNRGRRRYAAVYEEGLEDQDFSELSDTSPDGQPTTALDE
jgi:hypothetical protein